MRNMPTAVVHGLVKIKRLTGSVGQPMLFALAASLVFLLLFIYSASPTAVHRVLLVLAGAAAASLLVLTRTAGIDPDLARSRAVNRLLDFSQTIQGAGKPEQVLAALSHYLRGELNLAGIAILAHEPDSMPANQLKICWPDDLMR